MRFTIFSKLFFSIVMICGVIIVSMTLSIQQNFRSELQNFVNQSETSNLDPLMKQAKRIYTKSNSWDQIKQNPILWQELIATQTDGHPLPVNHHPEHPAQGGKKQFQPKFTPISFRLSLLDVEGNIIAHAIDPFDEQGDDFFVQKVPITLDSALIGWLGIKQKRTIANPLADAFSHKQLQTLLITSLVAAIFAVIIAYFLMRHFLKPLHELRKGANALADGRLDYYIPITSSDELAELTQNFNQLAKSLQQQKETRDQWLSDISHELRTPVAVFRSEIEAIQDGIRQADEKNLALLHQQILNLTKLINDLHQLSLSDAGMQFHFEDVNLPPMLQKLCEQHKPRLLEKNIHLKINFDSKHLFNTTCDPKAISQVITNLLENSYRYTDANGVVIVDLIEGDDRYQISVEDSSPGVPKESLNRLFDRLYRVDKSRSRASGGSGLGLAICKQIIEAHNGEIVSEDSQQGGLKITLNLPKEI